MAGRGFCVGLVDQLLRLIEAALGIQRVREQDGEINDISSALSHGAERLVSLPRVALGSDRVSDDQAHQGGRDGAFGQGELRRRSRRISTGCGRWPRGRRRTADVGVQHAQRLEQVRFGPGVAAGVLEQLLGAGDRGIGRDGQQ